MVQLAKRQFATQILQNLAGGFLLSGILVYRCPRCGGAAPLIPRIAQLHRMMAKILVEKPSALTGPEIRFLRKHAGFSAQEFANALGVDASHLSRVETSKPGYEKLGKPADRLARFNLAHPLRCPREPRSSDRWSPERIEAGDEKANSLRLGFKIGDGRSPVRGAKRPSRFGAFLSRLGKGVALAAFAPGVLTRRVTPCPVCLGSQARQEKPPSPTRVEGVASRPADRVSITPARPEPSRPAP